MNNRLMKYSTDYYCIHKNDEYFHFTPEEFKQFLTIVIKDVLYEVKCEIQNEVSISFVRKMEQHIKQLYGVE